MCVHSDRFIISTRGLEGPNRFSILDPPLSSERNEHGQLGCAPSARRPDIVASAQRESWPPPPPCTSTGLRLVVAALTTSIYTRAVHGFAIGRCGAGRECLGSLSDAREVLAEVGNMDVRAQRVRGRSTSRGTFGSGPLAVGVRSEQWLRRRQENGARSTMTCALGKTI